MIKMRLEGTFTRVVVLSTLCACGPETPPEPVDEIALRADTAGDTMRLTLSRSLNDIAARSVDAHELRADLRIGSRDDGFGHLSDVASTDDGRIFVSDLLEKGVRVFAPDGHALETIGHEGKGPGELTDPIATATMGRYLVVMQTTTPRFSVFHVDGRFVGSSLPDMLANADWQMFYFRGDLLGNDRPYQTTAEDWTRRLISLDESTFAFLIQDNERNARVRALRFPFDAPPVHVVRFDTMGTPIDTIETSRAPPSREIGIVLGTPTFDQPVYARRPIFAAGAGWTARGHGSRPFVDVFNGSRPVVVRWPNDPRPVSEDARIEAARWLQRSMARYWPNAQEFERDWNRKNERERQTWWQRIQEDLAFPDTVPQVTAAYGAGECLWLAGLAPRDYADGTALTWVGINLSRQATTAVRIGRVGSRIRHIDRTHVFASYRDDLGVHFLERYPIPLGMTC